MSGGTCGVEAETLELMFSLSVSAIPQAVAALRLPAGSHGLDAGCGVGCHAGLLLDAAGPSGHLTALDISAENLAWAREHHGNGRSVDWVTGDVRDLPFPDASFDWIWCADTLWPGAVIHDPVAVLRGFRRVTKLGGTVALVYWSSQTLLPGHPGLEARLNAAFVDTVPYLTGVPPELGFLRATSWLDAAGFAGPQARTFTADMHPPFAPAIRRALAACFDMFWGNLADRVSEADWGLYQALCDPISPRFIGDAPGYYAFLTYTVFWGRVPEPR